MRARRVGSLGRAGREARELCWRSRTCINRKGEEYDLDNGDDVESDDQLVMSKKMT